MVEIRLEGPGKNALGTKMINSVMEAIDAAKGAPLLFTGSGDAFSAGLNLREVEQLDPAGMTEFLDRLVSFFETIWLYPGPTAAAVNGHAIAGGCILAMCCDHAVATDNSRARIGLNEVAIGLRFPPALLRFVQATVSPPHLNEVVLGAGLHKPHDALRLGLVHAVSADPVADATAKLSAWAKHSPAAYSATKRDLRDGVMSASDAEKAAFQKEVVPFWTSPELKAQIRAILGG
jgi:enoyl-CoA hydratase/carnithine racemase